MTTGLSTKKTYFQPLTEKNYYQLFLLLHCESLPIASLLWRQSPWLGYSCMYIKVMIPLGIVFPLTTMARGGCIETVHFWSLTVKWIVRNVLLCCGFGWPSYNIKFTLMQLLITHRICNEICSITVDIVMAIDYNNLRTLPQEYMFAALDTEN